MTELNAEQAAVIASAHPRRVVLAGPGSGKTRVVVEQAVRDAARFGAQNVCCITYTIAGAGEMRRRLAARGVTLGYCGTLHALALRSLGGTVIDQDEVDEQFSALCQAMCGKTGTADERSEALRREEKRQGAEAPQSTPLALAAAKFVRTLRQNCCWTFGMLLVEFRRLLDGGSGQVWESVLWDEAQDSGEEDMRIMLALPAVRKLVVGDYDQSIFGFRGARPACLASIALSDSWELHRLSTNYRCAEAVCSLANSLLEGVEGRPSMRTLPHLPGGGFVQQIGLESSAVEGPWLVGQLVTRDLQRESVAVLCRTNQHAAQIADSLGGHGLVVSRRTLRSGGEFARLRKAIQALASPHSASVVLAAAASLLGKKAAAEAAMKARLDCANLGDMLGFTSSGSLVDRLAAVGCDQRELARARRLELELDAAHGEGNWTVADAAAAQLDEVTQTGSTDGVTVCTAHAAKGREWDHVFIVGLEDGLWPTRNGDLEEERRLLYVAVTRARRSVSLSWCRSRAMWRGPHVPPGPAMQRAASCLLEWTTDEQPEQPEQEQEETCREQ